MAQLTWDSTGSRFYETGISKAVFFDELGVATPWNGLTSVTEDNSALSETVSFVDGYRYMNKVVFDSYSGVITAFTYPDEFEEYIGEAGQKPKYFNLSYQTKIGNDLSGIDYGYKIHIIYNALAIETTKEFVSFGSSITPTEFSWNIKTLPVTIPDLKPSSHIIIDSSKTNAETLSIIENLIYGTDYDNARLPSVEELLTIFNDNAYFRIIDHGDGTFTATGSDEYVKIIDAETFELDSPSVYILSSDTFRASSL
jgi:hypothetical protein